VSLCLFVLFAVFLAAFAVQDSPDLPEAAST